MLLLIVYLSLAALPAAADFQSGLQAYERKDYATALKEWQPLAEKGDANAQYNLGLLYAQGAGGAPDFKKAAEWYEKAAQQGVAAAQYNLAIMYSNGQGAPKDLQKAAEWYQKAANAGVDPAANNLGAIYNEGAGAFTNFAQAEKWYRRAAEKGIASAQFNLGVMYDIGQGVQQDFAEAMKWYRQAADQGLASAMTNVGILYYNAQGVKRDLLEAYAWFARAGERGDERGRVLAQNTLKKLRGGDVQRAQELARNWQPKPAVKVDEAAQLALAESNSSAPPVMRASTGAPQPPVAEPAKPAATSADRGAVPAAPPPPQPQTPKPPAPPAEASETGAIQHTWNGVARIVAVGDVHGDYEQLFEALRSSGLIDTGGNWTGGRAHLVQTGDILDRGPDSRKVMELLMHLEPQAEAAGGKVHVLLGNHEAMNLYGDMRYVSPGEIAAFRDEHPEEAARKVLPASARAHPDANWQAQNPPGMEERREALSPKGYYGQWLAGKNAVIKIDDTLFVHAGISPKYAGYTIAQINSEIRNELHDLQKLHGGMVLDEEGPLWYRGMTSESEDAAAHIDEVLRHFGVKRIVVGHSYSGAAITPRFGGKVIMIDIGLPRVYDNIGKMGTLIIEDGRPYALHRGKKLALPEQDGRPMLDYLKQAAAADPSPSPLASRISELERKLGANAKPATP
jgi:TPR repeat protein